MEFTPESPPPGQKWCLWGGHFAPLDDFLPAPKGEMGRSKNCKKCHEERKAAFGGTTDAEEAIRVAKNPDGPAARVKRIKGDIIQTKKHLADLERQLVEAEIAATKRPQNARRGALEARVEKQREKEAEARFELEQKRRERRLRRTIE